MRRATFWLSLVLIFVLPWEDSVAAAGLGSIAKVMGLVVAACWLSTILIEGRFRNPQLFHGLVLLFFLWNVVTMFWTRDLENSIQRIETYGQIFILILILWEIYQKTEDLMAGLQAYVLGAFIPIISTIINYISGTVAVAFEGRFSATGINAVDLALILILGLPAALHLFFEAGRNGGSRILRLVNLAYIPLALFAIVLTGSRTSLFAIIPFGIYIFGSQQINFIRKAMTLFSIFILALVLLPFAPQTAILRLAAVGDTISAGDLSGRIDLWKQAIGILTDHPFLGIGGGAADSLLGSPVHNTYLSVAAETGFIGFVFFLVILLIVLYQAVSLPNRNAGFWTAIFMTWAIGVLSLSWEFRKLTWLILSFVVIQAGILHEQVRARKAEVELSRSTRQPVEMNVLEVKTKAIE